MDFSRFNLNIFLTEVLFYAVSFIIAILSILQINKILAAQAEITRMFSNLPEGENPVLPANLASVQGLNAPEFFSISQFAIAFILATLFFIFLIKTRYGARLFNIIFFIALFAGSQIIFRVWASYELSLIFAFLLVLSRYLLPLVFIHNIAAIIAITGVAINLGINITPGQAVIILVVVSIYDYFAVYVTGHMVRMLKSTISSGTIFAMIVPQYIRGMAEKVSEAGRKKMITEKSGIKNAYVYLGGGDLAFPLIMVIAAMKAGLFSAIFTAIGALFGLLALNIIFMMQKERKPMAALPPLALFSILGFLASLI